MEKNNSAKSNLFSADSPIELPENDWFQRHSFAKGISNTITGYKNSDSIVLGIYGRWGEGKTSLFNLISYELKQHQNTIVVNFNPWRYTDEVQVLKSFFEVLARSLDSNLKSKAESIGQAIEKYADALSPINLSLLGGLVSGSVVDGIQKTAAKLSNPGIDALKDRIEKLLQENKKRIVVFIDDIDRLDINEIQVVFKLVKLTADFPYTSYVLAFDDNLVASVLAPLYGRGEYKDGYNFLEKIIQLPLRLPTVQKGTLKDYCFRQIENSITANDIQIEENELRRFVAVFIKYLLPKLTTPRMAVRLGNTISFVLPLLKGEASMTDLMLIECIRVFYPELYDFIKENRTCLTTSKRGGWNTLSSSPERVNESKQLINDVLNKYPQDEANRLKELLIELFPILKEIYYSHVLSDKTFNDWYIKKRIASLSYFDRYFSYAVITGELPDTSFEAFLKELETSPDEKIIKDAQALIEGSNANEFVTKLRFHASTLSPTQSMNLALALCRMGNCFPDNNTFLSFVSPLPQSALLIVSLVANIEQPEYRKELLTEIIKKAQPLTYAFEIEDWFANNEEVNDGQQFTTENFVAAREALVERVVEESKHTVLFEKYQDYASLMFRCWRDYGDKEELRKHIESELKYSPNRIESFLMIFAPQIRSTSVKEPYRGDMEKTNYDFLASIISPDYVYDQLKGFYGDRLTGEYKKLWHLQTPENLANQFVSIHLKVSESKAIPQSSSL